MGASKNGAAINLNEILARRRGETVRFRRLLRTPRAILSSAHSMRACTGSLPPANGGGLRPCRDYHTTPFSRFALIAKEICGREPTVVDWIALNAKCFLRHRNSIRGLRSRLQRTRTVACGWLSTAAVFPIY